MNQTAKDSSRTMVKAATKLDNLPEDIALLVVAEVRSWPEKETTLRGREKAMITRNSIFRALALSCWANLRLYLPILLHDVRITIIDIFTFSDMLKSRPGFGHWVNSVCFKNVTSIPKQKSVALQQHADMISTLPASASMSDCFGQATGVAAQEIYEELAHLSTLILLDVHFFPNFQVTLREKVIPNPIFESLKKLWILKWEDPDRKSNLSGRETLWLLLFLPVLEEACLQFDMTTFDFELLSECNESFKGKSSVSKLSLGFDFHYQARTSKTWWGSERELSQTWIGNSKKTESIMRLLQVSRRLTCLELFNFNSDKRTGDKTMIVPTCIAGLEGSFSTLRNLRLIGFDDVLRLDDLGGGSAKKLFSSFKSLRILSADLDILNLLARCPDVSLPPTLEIVFFYLTSSGKLAVDEEMLFTNVLRSRLWPQLKQVLVSSAAFAEYTVPQTSPPSDKIRRRRLEKLDMFTSGRVKLRTVEGDEIVGDYPRDFLMSLQDWSHESSLL